MFCLLIKELVLTLAGIALSSRRYTESSNNSKVDDEVDEKVRSRE